MEQTNFEHRSNLGTTRNLPPIEDVLNRCSGTKFKACPLEKLKNVSFLSNNPFSSDLSQLGQSLKNLPIHLPNDGAYFLELTNNELHVYKSMDGIQNFSVVDGAAIEQIAQNDEVIIIDIRTKEGRIRLVLHRYSFEDCKNLSSTSSATEIFKDMGSSRPVRRTTSPWRSSQLETYQESYCSESSGGLGGER